MAKGRGIGGVFLKSKGKGSELAAWYEKNLGISLESWGGAILERKNDKAVDGGQTVRSAANALSLRINGETLIFSCLLEN